MPSRSAIMMHLIWNAGAVAYCPSIMVQHRGHRCHSLRPSSEQHDKQFSGWSGLWTWRNTMAATLLRTDSRVSKCQYANYFKHVPVFRCSERFGKYVGVHFICVFVFQFELVGLILFMDEEVGRTSMCLMRKCAPSPLIICKHAFLSFYVQAQERQ